MNKDTAIKKLRAKYRDYIKLDVWRSESARLMQKECDEIADFIEQQSEQIEKMKCCTNCCNAWNGEPAEDSDECEDCVNISNWGWGGGSE